MAPRIKPKAGDVLEVRLLDGQYAYLQMVSDSDFGHVARVLAGRFPSPVADVAPLAGGPHEYMMLADLRYLVREGHARRVGCFPVPAHGAWAGLKITLPASYQKTRTWALLEDGRPVALQIFDALPPASERRSIPLAWLGSALDVVYQLMASRDAGLEPGELEQWQRQHGYLDPEPPAAGSGPPDDGRTRHFAVFAPRARLGAVRAKLRRAGFTSEVLDDEDAEVRLLVITAVEPRSASVNDQWDQVAAIVQAAGGEYDGWEAEVEA